MPGVDMVMTLNIRLLIHHEYQKIIKVYIHEAEWNTTWMIFIKTLNQCYLLNSQWTEKYSVCGIRQCLLTIKIYFKREKGRWCSIGKISKGEKGDGVCSTYVRVNLLRSNLAIISVCNVMHSLNIVWTKRTWKITVSLQPTA